MVNSVGNSSAFIQTSSVLSSNSQNQTLSSYQKEYIGTLLENYDPSNLTSDDALAIVSSLKDQGIAPSEELASLMADSGFDAREIGDLARDSGGLAEGGRQVGAMPPPPPPQGGNQVSEEEEDYISTLLDSLLTTDDSDDSSSSTSFDNVLNYTSRIVNLNQDSQDQVMKMIEELSGDENDYSKQEVSAIVKYNLTQILSNPDNYNRVSFYA
ncbi:hypothetical protein ACKGJI_09915 [Sulfurospirillum sp. 1307]|jgi:hypothetical protein